MEVRDVGEFARGMRGVREKGAERSEEREVWREGGGRGVLESEFGLRKRGGMGGEGM